MRVAVIGAGYVGLTAAACIAERGHIVTAIEADPERLALLQSGNCPLQEPGLPGLIRSNMKAGRLHFTCRYQEVVPGATVTFIAVQTPAGPSGETDTSYVLQAIETVLPHLRPGSLLVLKSTVPPGTTDAIAETIAAEAPGIQVICNPEFLRQGAAVHDFLDPDRVVIGSPSGALALPLLALYEGLSCPTIICSRRSAEVAKYASNAALAMRISFINEVADICDGVGADISEVGAIVGADSRIGPAFLNAGLGWGGSCFPKDILALIQTADSNNRSHVMLDSIYEVNARQRERAFEQLTSAVRYRRDPTVAVLGLAFKPGTDDVRGSPSLEIIARLLEEGCRVNAHDPSPGARAAAVRALPNISYFAKPFAAVTGSDALLLATDWPEYASLDWSRVRSLMRGDLIVDGRNQLDPALMQGTGFDYRCFGVPTAQSADTTPRLAPERPRSGHRVRASRSKMEKTHER